MVMWRQYYIENSPAGRSMMQTHGNHTPFHIAYVCPQCGELWARALVDQPSTFLPFERVCPNHGVPSGVLDRLEILNQSKEKPDDDLLVSEFLLRSVHLAAG